MALPSRPLPPEVLALRGARAPSEADLRAALTALLADPAALRARLARAIDDDEVRARVVRRSYFHANGFAKLVLHADDGFRVRLHVWPAGEGRLGESDPHDHRWAFASTVLVGDGLDVVEYEVADEGRPHVEHRYDGRGLAPHRGVLLRDTGAGRRIGTGEQYTTAPTVVHTVKPVGDGLVATLVVQGPHVNDTAAVYLDADGGATVAPGYPVTEEDVRRLVGDVLAVLEPAPAPGGGPRG